MREKLPEIKDDADIKSVYFDKGYKGQPQIPFVTGLCIDKGKILRDKTLQAESHINDYFRLRKLLLSDALYDLAHSIAEKILSDPDEKELVRVSGHWMGDLYEALHEGDVK